MVDITVIEAYDIDARELSLKLQKEEEDRLTNNTLNWRNNTIGYYFEPLVVYNSNLKLHHQHILMTKDDGITFNEPPPWYEASQEELRMRDMNNKQATIQQTVRAPTTPNLVPLSIAGGTGFDDKQGSPLPIISNSSAKTMCAMRLFIWSLLYYRNILMIIYVNILLKIHLIGDHIHQI